MTDTCPKCSGWLEPKADDFGPYLRCLFCGTHIDLLKLPQSELDLLAQFPGLGARKDVSHAVSGIKSKSGHRRRDPGYYGAVQHYPARR